VRPIYHHLSDRVKAHVFLCMLAYYVEWQMRERIFKDIISGASVQRPSLDEALSFCSVIASPLISSKRDRPPPSKPQAATKTTPDLLVVHPGIA
jgi:hypothetical protein